MRRSLFTISLALLTACGSTAPQLQLDAGELHDADGGAPLHSDGGVAVDGGEVYGRTFTGRVTNAFGSRDYTAYVPTSYRPGTPVPLVVGLHGCTQTGADFAASSRFNALAETSGFIVAYPEQSTAANPQRCWNWFTTANQERDRGEPALIADVLRDVGTRWSVDPKRTYLSGISAGGAMTVVMGALYPDRFAAIAVHAGCQFKGFPCTDFLPPDPTAQGDAAFAAMGAHERVVPVIVFHGSADAVVVPSNAGRVIAQWARTNDRAFDDAVAGEVDATPESTTEGQVPSGRKFTHSVYRNSTSGETVMELYLVDGMGHAYSGGAAGEPYTDQTGPDATALSYAFFLAHPAP